MVSQFLVLDWNGDISLQLCGAVDIILKAQNTTIQTPVLLHCRYVEQYSSIHTVHNWCVCVSDGVKECGVVCVVMVAVEQGLAEGLVDIPSAVRRVRAQLPTAVSSLVSLHSTKSLAIITPRPLI